ncbi:SPFH domain-containing protein, partial [Streptomyces sp. MZ04]
MSATAASEPQTPQPSHPDGQQDPATRSQRIIHSEATTEIPLHLLFRDDPDDPGVSLSPAVVRRRQGRGEQPRTAARRTAPRPASARPVPAVDPSIAEWPARVLPGGVGVLGGAVGAAGCAAALWWA